MRALADLHIHSTFSDGTDTPTEIVRKAEQLDLGGIALTDHDTISGLKEFFEADASPDLIRVPGLEISTEFKGLEVHVLGYYIPLNSSELQVNLQDLQQARVDRFPKMVEKLRELGIEIEQDRVDTLLRETESPGRPHLAALLVELGIVNDTTEAFRLYLDEDKPVYVKKRRMETCKAIGFLRSVGAVPVIAHPLAIETQDFAGFMREMVNAGVLGVEVEYDYEPMGISLSLDVIREAIHGLDLIETGGSDYHGEKWKHSIGDRTVSIEVIQKLKEMSTCE
ncbi:MAG: PHP domain-containing protein [Candidatus Thorarchaeota archaeon]